MPTRESNHSAVLVDDMGQRVLLDCGEGTQKQLLKIGVHPSKIDIILITHWHADHSIGLVPLIQSMELDSRQKELLVIGPKGTRQILRTLSKIFPINTKFKITVKESNTKTIKKIYEDNIIIRAILVNHSVPCVNYSIEEKEKVKVNTEHTKKYGLTKHPLLGDLQKKKNIKYEGKTIKWREATIIVKGKKLSYVVDTIYEPRLIKFVKESDMLICESTYSIKDKLLTKKSKHMTTIDAAQLANKGTVKELVLTHFSKRYKNRNELLEEAKKEFENTKLAKEFLTLNI